MLRDRSSLSSAKDKTAKEREALRASKEEEKGKPPESCSLQLELWMSQWFLHNHAPRQFRTSISELICKHWVLPEAAEAGRFTFLLSRREHSGGADALWKGQGRSGFCWDSVHVSGLEGYTLWNRVANLPLLILSGSPAELYVFKVSHKSQMHIAVYSGLIIKKWAQMIHQKKPQ